MPGDTGVVIKSFDYRSYGDTLSTTEGMELRQGFIGKEKDVESQLGDYGVRMYDDGLGRFTSNDPLWEKYLAWSPCVYSKNNPINYFDDNGYGFNPAGASIINKSKETITIVGSGKEGDKETKLITLDLKPGATNSQLSMTDNETGETWHYGVISDGKTSNIVPISDVDAIFINNGQKYVVDDNIIRTNINTSEIAGGDIKLGGTILGQIGDNCIVITICYVTKDKKKVLNVESSGLIPKVDKFAIPFGEKK